AERLPGTEVFGSELLGGEEPEPGSGRRVDDASYVPWGVLSSKLRLAIADTLNRSLVYFAILEKKKPEIAQVRQEIGDTCTCYTSFRAGCLAILTVPCVDKKRRLYAETPSQKTLLIGILSRYLSDKAQ